MQVFRSPARHVHFYDRDFSRVMSRLLRSRALSRSLNTFSTLVGISILVFLVLRVIPGDSITSTFGTETSALSPEKIQSLKSYYGIDKPLIAQYVSWVQNFLSGNFGVSYSTGVSVADLTKSALPVTIELAFIGTVFGVLIGTLLGMYSASKPGSFRDFFGQTLGLLALAIPGFVLSTSIVTVMANTFHYFPNGFEYSSPIQDLWMNVQQMIFPGLVLSIAVAAPIMRTVRSALLETVEKDFVRTARGKGLRPRDIRVKHVLRNSLIPIVTMTGIQFGYLLGGTVIVERIFALPGMGQQIVDAILERDYATVQSSVMVVAVMFVAINTMTDLIYRKIDPRIE